MKPLKILMVTSEVSPLAKTGGLADMVSGLSLALATLGHDVRVVLPRYTSVRDHIVGVGRTHALDVRRGGLAGTATAEELILRGTDEDSLRGPKFFAVQRDEYYERVGLYQESGKDYPDNLARFAYFSSAVLELMALWEHLEGWVPDVVHGHDWQTGLLPVYLKSTSSTFSRTSGTRTLLTIHNLGYQGIFPGEQFDSLGLPRDYFTPQALEFYGSVNLLKGGIIFSDALTTVSPTYCREIQTSENGFGLEGVLRERCEHLTGIVNGIDTAVWNPETDPWIAARYSIADRSGKATCKSALQEECGLPIRKVPLLAVVSRLVSQKGIDLLVDAASIFLAREVQLVVLGTGEPELESQLLALESGHADKVKVFLKFDEGLSHRIQAGSDLFLVPSRYEPCGLTQLYSLRYGTVPIVRRTGGLADTVVGVADGSSRRRGSTGFLFDEPSGIALARAIDSALDRYNNKRLWSNLSLRGMHADFSWMESARQYVKAYEAVVQS